MNDLSYNCLPTPCVPAGTQLVLQNLTVYMLKQDGSKFWEESALSEYEAISLFNQRLKARQAVEEVGKEWRFKQVSRGYLKLEDFIEPK